MATNMAGTAAPYAVTLATDSFDWAFHSLARVPLALLLMMMAALACLAGQAMAVSTDRAGNVFWGDEDIVLKTTATGAANWTLTNDYGETIAGSAPVQDGKVRISAAGLRFGRYTFAVEGDGEIGGGIVPPVVEMPSDLSPAIFAPFQNHWNNPEEALMWKQFGMWELRYEFRLDGSNPSQGVYRFDPAIDAYMKALADQGLRPSFKLNGAPKWNDSSTDKGKWGEPKSYPDYEEALRQFAKHYLPFGMDRYYIINEPEAGGWWTGGWPGYYKFLKSSNKVVKEVDKNILTVAPEMWSCSPGFADAVINSGDLEIFSGHYTSDNQVGNVHGSFYFTRMRKAGKPFPFVNGEEFADWPANFDQRPREKMYPGIVGGSSQAGTGPVLLASLDVNAYRTVYLHLTQRGAPDPFIKYEAGNVVPGHILFQNRADNDELAGAHILQRLTDAPPHVMAWMFARGGDRFLVGYVAIGQLTQLIEIGTTAKQLRIVDCFGNQQTATPVAGKVRVLLSNTEQFIHGLTPGDTITYLPHLENEKPQIADPGKLSARAGAVFRFRMDGRDPDAVLMKKVLSLPTWSLAKAPEGMTIRPGSGLIEWTPAQPGAAEVTVRLQDAEGASADQSVTIDVLDKEANLPPTFISWPGPVAEKGTLYRYTPKAVVTSRQVDIGGQSAFYVHGTQSQSVLYVPETQSATGVRKSFSHASVGKPISYTVEGPAGMKIDNDVITWKPDKAGVFPVKVTATDLTGGKTEQQYELVVCNNPDRPSEGPQAPRMPTDLTLVAAGPGGTTLVWNTHGFEQTLIERRDGQAGQWKVVHQTDTTSWTDKEPVAGPRAYRAVAYNGVDKSEPTAPVSGVSRAPLADAGPSVKLDQPGSAGLDAGMSKDPDGRPVTYQWTIINAPLGSKPTLENADKVKAKFTVDKPGVYTVGLRVTAGQDVSTPDYAWVVVGADATERVAYVGPTQLAVPGQPVKLNALTASPATKMNKWFWRWHDLPLTGYVPILKNHERQAGITPELPGVYWVMMFPQDGDTFGYPDFARVIVAPRPTPTSQPTTGE